MSGRITAIAVGPGGNRVYAGAANGGVWFSSDGGLTWTPLDDYAVSPSYTTTLDSDSLAVGAIAVNFGAGANSDTVFVGTGEPGASDGYFGVGIKFSSNGGGSWTREATNLASKDIFRIAIDPDTPGTVFAATTGGLYQRPGAAPFTTWNQVSSPNFVNANGWASDLVIAGSGAAKTYYVAFWGDQVYSSADTGVTWNPVPGIAAPGRAALAAGESDPTVVYALLDNGSLYRLDNGTGGSFQQVGGVPNALFYSSFVRPPGQGSYDIVLAADPSNANIVYLAGDLTWDGDWTLSFYKGTITGGPGAYSFGFQNANDIFINPQGQPDSSNVPNDPTWIGRGVHPDAHSFAFATNAGGTHDATSVWIGTDGGLFQSPTSGTRGSFVARNTGLAITEMTFIAQRADDDPSLFGGAQDQGNLRFRGEEVCFEAPEGDGGGCAVDPNNGYQVMRQYVGASLSTSTDGGNSGTWTDLSAIGAFLPIGAAPSAAQQSAAAIEGAHTGFYSPIAVSPAGVIPTTAAFGTDRLWLTLDWGATWTTLPTNTNPYGGGGTNLTQDVLDDPNPTVAPTAMSPASPITAIAFASGTRIFAATQNAVWQFDLNLGAWSMTAIATAGLPGGHSITALAPDSATAGSFYVALGGAAVDHVWYFDGTNWQSAGLSQAVLDVPAHAIVVDPANANIIYLGTDVGVWRGIRGGAGWNWSIFSQGLPESAVMDLKLQARARLLRTSTHGRGVWEIPIDATLGRDPEIYLRVNYADDGRIDPATGSRNSWVDGASDPTALGFHVYHWMSADIKVRRPMLSGLPTISPQQDFLDYAVNIGDYIDSTTHIETADQPGTTDQIFIEVHNRGLTPLPGSQVQVLLLLTDAAAGLPALPGDYATHIQVGDSAAGWLGPDWLFADPGTPYRTLPGVLSPRTPQVVRYDVDFSALNLPAGHDHVCAAAFITTPADPLTAAISSLDQLTMADRHAAHRNLHLVAATAMPKPPMGQGWVHPPQSFLLDFHNAQASETVADLVFQRSEFPGHLSVVLSRSASLAQVPSAAGFTVVEHGRLETAIATHLGQWLEPVGELIEHAGEAIEQAATRMAGEILPTDLAERRRWKMATLDRTHVYVSQPGPVSVLKSLPIPASGRITAAITVQAPPEAKPGDRFRFDVIQRGEREQIVGGSSYVFAVVAQIDSRLKAGAPAQVAVQAGHRR